MSAAVLVERLRFGEPDTVYLLWRDISSTHGFPDACFLFSSCDFDRRDMFSLRLATALLLLCALGALVSAQDLQFECITCNDVHSKCELDCVMPKFDASRPACATQRYKGAHW